MKPSNKLEYYYCVYRNLLDSGLEKGDVNFYEVSDTQALIWRHLYKCDKNNGPLVCDLITKTIKEACIIRLHFLINGYEPIIENSGLTKFKIVIPLLTPEEIEYNLIMLKNSPFTHT